ncbi:Glutathione S-transferase [Eumeta japonica]|uniref:Glutathione S-transferase n=1 Tax=Eumeta variegata TaxID=151549 RepID=A0A4C1X1U4_EUMVA|nr:Glutathione S-transferase [Eumeta japonica]
MLLEVDVGEHEIRLVNKLTEQHVNKDKIPKMKVSVAAQVFSQRVSAAMRFLAMNKLKSNHVNSSQIELLVVTAMSLRPFSKLFKPFKKNEKQDAESVPIPYEGLDLSIKLLLAYVGKETTDIKIWKLQDEESCKEQNLVQGQDKVKTDNKCGIHGTAILRCLGKCHGLSGADPFEDLEIDQIVEVFNEFRMILLGINNTEKCEEKSANTTKVGEMDAQAYLTKFDAVIATNRGHLALNKVLYHH